MNKKFYSEPASRKYKLLSGAILFFVWVTLLSSCATTKPSYYFKTLQKDTTISGLVNKDLESKINKGDNLAIRITSLSSLEDVMYNTNLLAPVNGAKQSGVFVDQEGNIPIHKLGIVKAEGLTRKELAAYLQKQLEPYLKDPIVQVQYLNHKVTVMGEVDKPMVIDMPEEQISVIDALVISGDVKEDARRDHILLIREDGNQKKVKIINLEDESIFSSPLYYLQPNDIVYVIPDVERKQKAEKRARFQSNFAIASAAISILVILLDRIFRK